MFTALILVCALSSPCQVPEDADVYFTSDSPYETVEECQTGGVEFINEEVIPMLPTSGKSHEFRIELSCKE